MKSLLLSALMLAAGASTLSAADYLDRSGWSWYTSSECAPEQDITGLKGICDDDPSTCWHSNWHAESGTPERSNPHWVMIDRGSDAKPFYGISYLPRQNNSTSTACTQWAVYLGDKPMDGCPSDSYSDILFFLGDPDYAGYWAGDATEKVEVFSKPSTARYLMFVNIQSNGSSSAACAEFNLLASASGGNITAGGHNALNLLLNDGSTHRIAIDGTALNISTGSGAVRLSNSSITVEYDLGEVKYFVPTIYEFAEGETYEGSKSDLAVPFDLTVLPAGGEFEALLPDITVSGPAPLSVAPAASGKVTLVRDAETLRSYTTEEFDALLADGIFTIPGIKPAEAGIYALTIPAEFIKEQGGARNAALEMSWTVNVASGIKAPEAVSTLSISRQPNGLQLGGITSSPTATLHSLNGTLLASAPVRPDGTAFISTKSLPRGIYILSASGMTLKITLNE